MSRVSIARVAGACLLAMAGPWCWKMQRESGPLVRACSLGLMRAPQ